MGDPTLVLGDKTFVDISRVLGKARELGVATDEEIERCVDLLRQLDVLIRQAERERIVQEGKKAAYEGLKFSAVHAMQNKILSFQQRLAEEERKRLVPVTPPPRSPDDQGTVPLASEKATKRRKPG